MTEPTPQYAPDREALRALYDAAIVQINAMRVKPMAGKFYMETADSVFEAGCLALSDHRNNRTPGTHRVHVVSAPAGGGKTSFSYAFMVALTRYAHGHPDAPYGCVFVVDQIKKADNAYKELNALMPGEVAVWTTEHDRGCKNRTRVPNPAAEFTKDELRHKAIIVVTHAFYNGNRDQKRHKAINVFREGHLQERALVVVDERPEEVEIYETTLKEAQDVKDQLTEKRPDLSSIFDTLMMFIMPYSYSMNGNSIRRPFEMFGLDTVSQALNWFTTKDAEYVLKSHASTITGLDRLFGFAKAMTQGLAFSTQSGSVVRFVGWQSKLIVRAGTVLLDATADIDGVTQLCSFREHTKVPQGHYGNLEIIHVPQHTKRRLSDYLKTAANQRAYVAWMVETIKRYMAPGERGLIVCKKVLFDAERVPNWPDGDPKFKDPDSYGKRYEWNIDGRMLCATHYGTGIGSNDWQEADVVFLFDEFFIPRRVAAATVQGLRGHRADEGDLASMTTINSKSHGVQIFTEGHKLRWTKQMALRGRGRFYDGDGMCGKQRLVISNDLRSFTANVSRLFPDATLKTLGDCSENDTWSERVIKTLSSTELPSEVTSTHLSRLLDRKWGTISTRVLTDAFHRSLRSIGWEYVPGKGCKGSIFKRISMAISQAA